MILVVDTPKTHIKIANGCLRIERSDKPFQRVPIRQLDQVIIYGNPTAEVRVWRELGEQQIPTVFLNARGRQGCAMLTSQLSNSLPFRKLQHQAASDQEAALLQAQYFIQKKFQSYDLSVRYLDQYFGAKQSKHEVFIEQRDTSLDKLTKANSYATLLGLEGQLAQAWFKLIASTLPERWKFKGRNRQPPRDPVNALLSLSYTLLTSETHQQVMASGLDPALGFLHRDAPARESFTLDIMELFRSGVDAFVIKWVAEHEQAIEEFYYREDTGCRLSKSIRPAYFGAWAEQRQEWPKPFNSSDEEIWPTTDLRQSIQGQLQQWRQYLQTSQQKCEPLS